MIKYIDNLFLTEKASKKVNKIKEDIEKKKFTSLACIICISNNSSDVFDIIPVFMLKSIQKLYDSSLSTDADDICVLGIAESKRAAFRLCTEMSAYYINSKSELSMREFFLQYTK